MLFCILENNWLLLSSLSGKHEIPKQEQFDYSCWTFFFWKSFCRTHD